MGKRSNFDKLPRNYYRTWDPRPVPALLPHITGSFVEPCAGAGDLVDQLEKAGHPCTWKSDIEPQREDIVQMNAFDFSSENHSQVITNPPWSRTKKDNILPELIHHFRMLMPTWMLVDADFMHIQKSKSVMPYCAKIVSIGRVKWIPESEYDGKDNCVWMLFMKRQVEQTIFHGRT